MARKLTRKTLPNGNRSVEASRYYNATLGYDVECDWLWDESLNKCTLSMRSFRGDAEPDKALRVDPNYERSPITKENFEELWEEAEEEDAPSSGA